MGGDWGGGLAVTGLTGAGGGVVGVVVEWAPQLQTLTLAG